VLIHVGSTYIYIYNVSYKLGVAINVR
jgi:hypothetical protein